MRFNPILTLLLILSTIGAEAQKRKLTVLTIGDPAPPLQVQEWLKGTPVRTLERGHIYVLEFWATWCGPCIKAMPHLSALAREYKDKVTIIGVDILEKKSTPLSKIKAFVDSMGHNMDYHVAKEDSNFMEVNWLYASEQQGIPITYIVNREGKIAWIGHPTELPEVLHKVVNNTWDLNGALASLIENKRLQETETSIRDSLSMLTRSSAKPETILLFIKNTLSKEPSLKYTPTIVFYSFSSLLKIDPSKANHYGKEVIAISEYNNQAYQFLIDVINWQKDKTTIPQEIYELGAEVFIARLNRYGDSINQAYAFKGMAEMYWHAKNKAKAIEAQQKAINALNNESNSSPEEVAKYQLKLQEYKNMK